MRRSALDAVTAIGGFVPENPGDHYIVCGGNALARRLVFELVKHYEVSVAVVVPPDEREHVDQIKALLKRRKALVDLGGITEEALREAGIENARAVAFVGREDQSNIHAALRSRAINPDIRVVIRMYNQRLGEHIERMMKNCTVLSASATAAPAFANAALNRPQSVRAGGRSLRVAIGDKATLDDSLCVVADQIDPSDPASIRMLPEVAGPATEWIEQVERISGADRVTRRPTRDAKDQRAVLRFLDSEPPVTTPLLPRLRWRFVDALRFFTSAQVRLTLAIAIAAALVAFIGIWYRARPLGWALYESLLDIAGSAVPDVYGHASAVGGVGQRVFQVILTFCGILLIPVVTAIFLENTASGQVARTRQPSAGTRDHVVIFGLGTVGTRVATLLHELGLPVVGVEHNPQARGIITARGLGLPVIVGDMPPEDALREAYAHTSRSVLALTDDDVANLEIALEARAIQPEVRVVVRLFDDDFAAHMYREFGGNAASRSVSYLAAPAFASAMMGQEVLGTLSVYRNVLLIAEIRLEKGSPIAGRELRDMDVTAETKVIAFRQGDEHTYQWRPVDRSRRLAAGDSFVVVATRVGLAHLHGRPS